MKPFRHRRSVVRQGLALVLFGLMFLAGHASGLTIVDEGVARLDTAIDCGAHRGRVVVRTGVHYQLSERDERLNGVSIAFLDSTSTALECCWVQFVWIEEVVTFQTPNGNVVNRVSGLTATTAGGPVMVSEDPNRSRWYVDAITPGDPCYEIEGVSIKDRHGTRIFDQPDNGTDKVGPAGCSYSGG